MPDPTVFPISPNAAEPLTESYAFLTDVMTAEDGTEQRVRLREHPTGRVEFGLLCEGREASLLAALLQAHQADQWAVPLWPYSKLLGAPVTAGATTIPTGGLDYLFRDWDGLGDFALLWRDAFTFELVHITGVSGGDLTCEALAGSWTALDYVVPVRLGRMPNAVQIGWDERSVVSGRVAWTLEASGDWLSGLNDGNDAEVLDEAYMEASRPDAIREEYRRSFRVLGDRNGYREAYVPTVAPALGREFLWFTEGFAAALLTRNFLVSRLGRAVPFWLVSPERELVLAAEASGGTITIQSVGYTAGPFTQGGARRYLRLRAPGGVMNDAVVASSVDNADGTETLTLVDALADTFPVATSGVSYRRRMRLDEDEVTLTWSGNNCAEARLKLREIPLEAPEVAS